MRNISLQEERKDNFQQKINENKKIVNLIKSKLSPLRKSNQKMFPIIKSQSSHHPISKSYLQTFVKPNRYEINLQIAQGYILEPHPLVLKAKRYLQQEKKLIDNSIQQEQKKSQIDMSKYLKMFEEKEERNNEQLLKMKKQAEKERKDRQYFMTETEEGKQNSRLSEEESSLFNARIRQKLNHRKLIALYRG